MDTSAQTVIARCLQLGSYSEEPDRLTRRFCSEPMRQVNTAVASWMQAAGMSVRQDAVCNIIGRYEASIDNAPTLLLGSHLDTVRDAGKYDGPLGVLVAIACVEQLHALQKRLPFAIEVLGFSDEEGLRFHQAFLGSRGATGTFDKKMLHLTDNNGIRLEDAIRNFGGNPEDLYTPHWKNEDLLGYCEIHIEQGPVLEKLNLPVGVVSAISGQNRFLVNFTGQAGHAGTVPMSLRRDALCAAAEFIMTVESFAQSRPELVATVGQITAHPGASNVIPGEVTLSLDVRHQDEEMRTHAYNHLQKQANLIAQRRHLLAGWQATQESRTVPCSPRLVGMLEQAIGDTGYPLHRLPSGAGHDGVILSHLTDIAMLFVRCHGGISHHPAEAVTTEDVAVAIRVMERFLTLLAQK